MKIFGTDGIRGEANSAKVNPFIMTKIALAIGKKIIQNPKHSLCRVIIGKDTRKSCYMIENALASGFLAAGIDVILLGPVPTPAISVLVQSMRCEAGIMISASHNPYHDNGIKIFNHNGEKISTTEQEEIENDIQSYNFDNFYAKKERIGKAKRIENLGSRYVEYIKNSLSLKEDLSNLKIAIDTANGAAYKIAPEALWELGAEVVIINNEPNGVNINKNCGSIHPESLAKKVIEEKCDFGIALDGDADRLVAVDEKGNVLNGNTTFALLADCLIKDGLDVKGAVGTILANLSLEEYFKKNKINFIKTNVGDKNIYYEMKKNNYTIGAEPSGHIIFSSYASTGDGLMAGIKLASYIKKSGKKLSQLSNIISLYPEIESTIEIKADLTQSQQIKIEQIASQIQQQHSLAQLTVRPSGTEMKIRIFMQDKDLQKLQIANKKLQEQIKQALL